MQHWLFMFRPDTYAKVQEHQTVGVRHSARRRFADIREGDRFAVYVSREKLLHGYGLVTSDPYEDDSPLFGSDQPYKHRCKVRFDKTDGAKPAGDKLWFLSVFQDLTRTTPTNMLLCKGGFMPISATDHKLLVAHIDGDPT